MLALILPNARIRVLSLLLRDPANSLYLREIARICGLPVRAVQREVALYEAMGLCERQPRGKQVFFRVRTDHPLFGELRALLLKASAPAAMPPAARTEPTPPAEARQRSSVPPSPGRTEGWRVW